MWGFCSVVAVFSGKMTLQVLGEWNLGRVSAPHVPGAGATLWCFWVQGQRSSLLYCHGCGQHRPELAEAVQHTADPWAVMVGLMAGTVLRIPGAGGLGRRKGLGQEGGSLPPIAPFSTLPEGKGVRKK